MEKANKYRMDRGFGQKPYLAVHLRHGIDWVNTFIDIQRFYL